MPPRIKIESITVQPPVEIIQLSNGLITLGREPENNVVIDSVAVSRRHASIFSVEDHWLLKDFESSNGTWINGVKVHPGAIRLLRHGDVIKLADFSLRLTEAEPRPEAFWRGFPPSLLVFYKEQFDSEFPLAAAGSSFQLGGTEGDFFIEGADPEAVFLRIHFKRDALEAEVPSVREQVAVNGMLVSGSVSIADRDELIVPPYRIVVSHPAVAQTSLGLPTDTDKSTKPIRAYEQVGTPQPGEADGWVSEAARRKGSLGQKYSFGTGLGGDALERTQSVPQVHPESNVRRPQTVSGYEMSASQKFSASYMDPSVAGKGMGENLLVILGVVIFILLVVFVIYLFTSFS